MIRPLIFCLCLWAATPVFSHGLTVFAYRSGAQLSVEASFANGRAVRQGILRVFDADDQLIFEGAVSGEKITTLPMMGDGRGLRIEVNAGNDHMDYWILTPADLSK